jgi:hypothetical protein
MKSLAAIESEHLLFLAFFIVRLQPALNAVERAIAGVF